LYFCKNAPEYHIIAAGSLLGVAVNREKYSFPIGKVDELYMYPLDFEEFLWAFGNENFVEEIRIYFEQNMALSEPLHKFAPATILFPLNFRKKTANFSTKPQ